MKKNQLTEFEKAASQTDEGFLINLWIFLKTNKKWWLLPIIAVLLIFGVLIMLSGTSLAPFIYTLF